MGFFDVDRGIAADPHADLGVFEDEIQIVESGCHFIGQGAFDQLGGLAALVGAGEEEHVVDDRTQAFQFFEVRLQHFEVVFCRTPARQGDLGLADQVGQR